MRLADILTLDRVTTSLPQGSKDEVLRALAGLFTDLPVDEVYRVFREREALASTGIGSGVAVPHGRLAATDKMQAGLAISHDGIDFDCVDGKPARIFIALVAPTHHGGDHLKALARISKLMRDETLRARLAAAQTPEEAYEALTSADAG
jgi:PTS system nitrogen regulatory IIA component